ncbi:hypothetical protein [Streptomyces sp. NPDC055287]
MTVRPDPSYQHERFQGWGASLVVGEVHLVEDDLIPAVAYEHCLDEEDAATGEARAAEAGLVQHSAGEDQVVPRHDSTESSRRWVPMSRRTV